MDQTFLNPAAWPLLKFFPDNGKSFFERGTGLLLSDLQDAQINLVFHYIRCAYDRKKTICRSRSLFLRLLPLWYMVY